jgi:hypothetical protein
LTADRGAQRQRTMKNRDGIYFWRSIGGLCWSQLTPKNIYCRHFPPEQINRFDFQLFGLQACISVWQQLDHLFSPGVNVGGQLQRSDTGAIADVLLLPHWFWGASISAAILALLWWSFRLAFRR